MQRVEDVCVCVGRGGGMEMLINAEMGFVYFLFFSSLSIKRRRLMQFHSQVLVYFSSSSPPKGLVEAEDFYAV